MNAHDFLFFDVLSTLLPLGALVLSLMLVVSTVKAVPQVTAAQAAAAAAHAPVAPATSVSVTMRMARSEAAADPDPRDEINIAEPPVILRSRVATGTSTGMRGTRPPNPAEHYAAA